MFPEGHLEQADTSATHGVTTDVRFRTLNNESNHHSANASFFRFIANHDKFKFVWVIE